MYIYMWIRLFKFVFILCEYIILSFRFIGTLVPNLIHLLFFKCYFIAYCSLN